MLKIRLFRKGRKKKPLYRIVIIEDSNQRNGKTVEEVGTYNPHTEPLTLTVKEDRVKYWVSVGAKPSNTVSRILSTLGLFEHSSQQSSNQKVSKKDRKKSEDK